MGRNNINLQLEGKTVLITGGDGGIGRGIALRFAHAGVSIVFTWYRKRDQAAETEKMIRDIGVSVISIQCDVSESCEVNAAVLKASNHSGGVDILVNNAGIYPVHPLLEMNEDDWNDTLNINLKGLHLMTQAVAKSMIQRKLSGVIINIASIEGEDPAMGHAHYDASKGGVIAYTRATALELAEKGIRVNAVSPGLIWNEGIEENWPEGVNRYLKAAPLGRLGMPEDVGDACLFLASPLSRWITGINLRVDGGVGATSRY